jgi:hypothetical protein
VDNGRHLDRSKTRGWAPIQWVGLQPRCQWGMGAMACRHCQTRLHGLSHNHLRHERDAVGKIKHSGGRRWRGSPCVVRGVLQGRPPLARRQLSQMPQCPANGLLANRITGVRLTAAPERFETGNFEFEPSLHRINCIHSLTHNNSSRCNPLPNSQSINRQRGKSDVFYFWLIMAYITTHSFRPHR